MRLAVDTNDMEYLHSLSDRSSATDYAVLSRNRVVAKELGATDLELAMSFSDTDTLNKYTRHEVRGVLRYCTSLSLLLNIMCKRDYASDDYPFKHPTYSEMELNSLAPNLTAYCEDDLVLQLRSFMTSSITLHHHNLENVKKVLEQPTNVRLRKLNILERCNNTDVLKYLSGLVLEEDLESQTCSIWLTALTNLNFDTLDWLITLDYVPSLWNILYSMSQNTFVVHMRALTLYMDVVSDDTPGVPNRYKNPYSGRNGTLHIVAGRFSEDVVKFFIEYMGDKMVWDWFDNTPMFSSVYDAVEKLRIVRQLLLS
jgi:hypothetical protein